MGIRSQGLIRCMLFASVITVQQCSFPERIHFTSENITIQYTHQIKDNKNQFSQIVDTKPFKERGLIPYRCSNNENPNIYCLKWNETSKFKIMKMDDHCEKYEYKTKFHTPLHVKFDIHGNYLYGGGEIDNQIWPINLVDKKFDSFVSKGKNSEAVNEPIWFTNTGFYIYVDESVPLFVSIENNILTLAAEFRAPYERQTNKLTQLSFKVCKYDDIKSAYHHAVNYILGKPAGVPDYKMVELPIWSTWAKYKVNINQSATLDFVNLIDAHKLPISQLEIDDKWETCYGSLTIDKKRFPNMTQLVENVHKRGYHVTIWVHPFVNTNCLPFFREGQENNYFVRNTNGSVKTIWWNGEAAHIDFTNPAAVDWYTLRLETILEETGIDSFKFDAGESSFMPQVSQFHFMNIDHPETNLKAYIRTAASFGSMVEVRSARQTQKYPIFVRMVDRETLWTGCRALSTIIPEVLHMNMIGYPFVLPDMIGGNGYGETTLTKELFVRWLQLTVFLPTLQFSYPPWEFGNEVVKLTEKYIQLHKQYAPKIHKAMKKAVTEGTMVNAPLWWIDPTDDIALVIGDEFLLEEDVLVAPIMKLGATSRDIYFPKGVWRDETGQQSSLIIGPKWERNFPAPLEILPYFTKMSDSASSALLPSLYIIIFSVLIWWSKLWK